MTIPAWAREGAKVVYTGEYAPDLEEGEGEWAESVVVGAVYTIRGFHYSRFFARWQLLVCEVRNPVEKFCDQNTPYEPGFHLDGFRPLVSTKTMAEDVAHIKALLEQGQPVSATSPAPVEGVDA